MRIIAGQFKGRPLPSPKDKTTRPTLARIKDSLFNTLVHNPVLSLYLTPPYSVLDLFCGTGQIGLEFLSRGAQHVTFVDSNTHNLHQINQLAKKWGVPREQFECMTSDLVVTPLQLNNKFPQIIYLDPPYSLPISEVIVILKALESSIPLARHSLLILELDPRNKEALSELYRPADLEKHFSSTSLLFYFLAPS